jgi:putative endonuclease
MTKASFVYIMSNHKGGTIYIGITNDLKKRVSEHKNKRYEGFTEKYNLNRLVYFEVHEDISFAIKREKDLKAWHRLWKQRLIEKFNPGWKDLFDEL